MQIHFGARELGSASWVSLGEHRPPLLPKALLSVTVLRHDHWGAFQLAGIDCVNQEFEMSLQTYALGDKSQKFWSLPTLSPAVPTYVGKT